MILKINVYHFYFWECVRFVLCELKNEQGFIYFIFYWKKNTGHDSGVRLSTGKFSSPHLSESYQKLPRRKIDIFCLKSSETNLDLICWRNMLKNECWFEICCQAIAGGRRRFFLHAFQPIQRKKNWTIFFIIYLESSETYTDPSLYEIRAKLKVRLTPLFWHMFYAQYRSLW